MDIEPHTFFVNISKLQHDNRGPSECYRQLSLLNYNLTEEELNSSVVDLYILHIFNKSNGLLTFIRQTLFKKEFEKCVVKGLEIIYTLINNFPQKLSIFVLDVNLLCTNIIDGTACSKIKVKSLELLHLSFEKVDKCLENQEHYLGILSTLRNCLKIKSCDTVKEKEYVVTGYFYKRFSYLIQDSDTFKNILILAADKEMQKHKYEKLSQHLICGIFTALSDFCEAFPLSRDSAEDKKIVEKLYEYLKTLSIAKSQNKFGNRAAISFFANHINLFCDLLIKEHNKWFAALMKWLSMGEQERKVGVSALRSFLQAIAHTTESMNTSTAKPILLCYHSIFRQLIHKRDATKDEKRLSIQGYKFFSASLHKHLNPSELHNVFMMIMRHFERTYILDSDSNNTEDWDYLPDYIQCIANFMQYEHLSSSELFSVQRAVVNMIRTFHGLPKLHHIFVIDALVHTLFSLRKTEHFDIFLENVIYQGIVWSCSHHHISDAELQPDSKQIITVKNYFPLWTSVLKLATERSYDKYGIYLEDRIYILTKIINQFVKTLMILINKLDVSVKPKDDVIATDIEEAYDVVHSDDYAIFLNIVDFYQEMFKHIESSMFEKCICKMIVHLINKCVNFPLVSGFYRLLSFALNIFNQLNLYDRETAGASYNNSIASSSSMDLNIVQQQLPSDCITQDLENCKETLNKFIPSLLHKMNNFKDELLISCLQVLLATPVSLIKKILSSCIGVFITVFDVGRSYITLAEMGLNTLEFWQENIDPADFEEFLVEVTPSLDTYLRSKSLGGLMQATNIEKRRKTARQLKKRKVLVEIEPELVKFQSKVLRFIGSQNSTVCEAFVSPDHVIEKSIVSHNLHLKLSLPYKDTVLDVYLEPFVTRIVDLSLYCSDRKTRIMASEMLQALVMVFLGRTKSMSQKGLEDLEELFKYIAMPLLQLACDVDQVVEQIFNPLFLQLIHWYTSPSQIRSTHTAVIIEVMMEGITHPTNSRLRDFAGKCTTEFITWTIKQTNEARIANDPINVKIIVKKMRFFSSHPDIAKKLGAALLFNNIYKELREERSLTSTFAFEILHIFITSLSLIEFPTPEAETAVNQIGIALRHLKRIFIEKPQMFRQTDPQRRIPNGLLRPDLMGVAQYLFLQTASMSKYCRDISIELFLAVAPLASEKNKNLHDFMKDNITVNPCSVFEQSLTADPSTTLKESAEPRILLEWLQALLCALDGYNFLVTHNLTEVKFSSDGEFFKAASFFLAKMRLTKITEALNLVCFKSWTYDLRNKEQFNTLKSSCILAFLKLTNSVLNDSNFGDTCVLFWNEAVTNQFLIECLFTPHLLGLEGDKQLEILTVLFGTIKRKLTIENRVKFLNFIHDYLEQKLLSEVDLGKTVRLTERNMVKGLILLQMTTLDDSHSRITTYAVKLLNGVMTNFLSNIASNKAFFVTDLPETVFQFCELVFKLALSLDGGFERFLQYFYESYAIKIQTWEFNKEVSFSLYLLIKFGDIFSKAILNKYDVFMKNIQDPTPAVEYILFVLNHKHSNKSYESLMRALSHKLLDSWHVFEVYIDNQEEKGLELLEALIPLCQEKIYGSLEIRNWILKLLNSEEKIWSKKNTHVLSVRVFSVLVSITSEVHNGEDTELQNTLALLSQKILAEVNKKPDNVILVEKFLTTLPSVKSAEVLTFLLSLYSKVNTQKDILSYLQECAKNNDKTTQAKFLSSIYEQCMDNAKNIQERKKIIHTALPVLFINCNIEVFEEFFENTISRIVAGLEDTSNLIGGITHFVLVETLFLRIPVGTPERVHCPITDAYGDSKLRNKVLKVALDAFKVKANDTELLRIYKCHAYNALASIISNSIKSPNFYDKLFIREENKTDILWQSIVDTNIKYNFPMELETIPKQRKILTSIRNELREKNNDVTQQKSLKYIESQRLFKSSLSEDITQFDFTNTVIRSSPKYSNLGEQERKESASDILFQSNVELDATEINNHECMATICGIIEHIFSSGINEFPSEGEEATLPTWMEGIRSTLLNNKTHKNIKIFLVKVIDNTIGVFQHYSKWFLTPLLQFIVDGCAGTDINYFITDVLVILASWAKSVTPNEIDGDLAYQAVRFITEKLTNERQDIFKYILDLVKLIVENWKHFLKAPHAIIFSKLNHSKADRRVEVGIHLASVFLVNDICPCEETDIREFLKKLLGIMESELRSIYKPCAETVGLVLKYVSNRGMEEEVYISDTNKVLNDVADGDSQKYALCLEGIALHYPSFVNSFHLCRVLSRIHCANSNLKIVFLKIIVNHTEGLDKVSDFRQTDWFIFLEDDNVDVQWLTLEVMLRTFKLLEKYNMFKILIHSICKNVSSPSILCRTKMYDFLKQMYTHCENLDNEVLELCKDVLVLGLTDTDVDIRDAIREFWSNNPKIPSEIKKKFSYILSDLYKTKTEEQFLGYASFFLLDSIRQNEINKEIFDNPLEDCNFEEYQLQTNWRLQHPSVVPMFAETFRTVPDELPMFTEGSFDVLRGTQEKFSFAPTPQTSKDQYVSEFTSLESALMVSPSVASTSDSSFINPNKVELSRKYKLPKKRFLRDRAKMAQNFAHLEVNKQMKKVEKRFESVREGEKKVTIYRKYRRGDFPDIQITLGSVLKPLQMLALYDGELSKILFSVIFKSLSDIVEYNNAFIASVSKSIEFIFTNSTQFNANLFATLLDILLKNKTQMRFKPNLIATVCQQSGLLSVGTLLLEEYIIHGEDGPSTSKKGVGATQENTEITCWLKLAELYKEMGEWDIVRTIFLEKMNCKEDVQDAIKYESSKKWREAEISYKKLVETDMSLERRDFYYESLFKCFAHLGEWEHIPEAIKSTCEDENKVWASLWDNGWYQQKILPWYISAQVKNTLFSGSVSEEFLTDLNSSYTNVVQSEHLRNNFSEELCLLWLFKRDTAHAAQYLRNSLENFLSDWQLLNPMFHNLRYNKILSLRNIIDVDKFLTAEEHLTDDSENSVKKLLNYWRATQKEYLPSIILSEEKLLYRKLFVKLLIDKLTKLEQTDMVRELKKSKSDLDLNFINLATEEGNYYMARKYFKPYEDTVKKKFNSRLNMLFGDILHLKAQITSSMEYKLNFLVTASTAFGSLFKNSVGEVELITGAMNFFEVNLEISRIISENLELFTKYQPKLKEIFPSQKEITPQNIVTNSEQKLRNYLIDGINTSQSMEENSSARQRDSRNNQFVTKALIKLAYYVKDQNGRDSDFVLFVLRGMRLDSSEARQLFPCILLKDNLGTELKDIFLTETEHIPTWMFLGWIPQLLANVDSKKIFAISALILRLAKTYPQAITYAYRLSKSNYTFNDPGFKETAAELVRQLDELLLQYGIVDKFLTALSNVSVPAASLEYYIKKMLCTKDIHEVIKYRGQMMEQMYSSTPDSRDNTYMLGNMYKTISKFKAEFMKINERSSDKVVKQVIYLVNEERKALLNSHPSNKKYKAPSVLLKDYCPWLANLSANRANLDLEIPGQYTGEKMPLVQHHVKISGFMPTIKVMSSLRKPIKVTMLGMDAKEYPFLVKFGEDIRQDQRVEQLFMLMNNIFKTDKKLHALLTYQVVPLTSSLGIIQWIENTTSLSDFIKIPLEKNTRLLKTYEAAENRYLALVCSGQIDVNGFGKTLLKNKDASKVVPLYREIVNMVPLDVLRSSLWSMTASTENFIAFRNNFVKSYAVICACHWILGIGDRHLNNSKVCMQNGKVLGIDFGHAFGTATQILPIPELVPIRLTPHLVHLMEPLKERGCFRDIMIDCLRSLRENREILLATMNVFIQEPSLDWLENASKFGDDDITRDSVEWYPNKKIEQAERKLMGASSSEILIEELEANRNKQYMPAYIKHVRGTPECKRNQLSLAGGGFLTVEDQVDSLIDHATDYNLLGRMYCGWTPWV